MNKDHNETTETKKITAIMGPTLLTKMAGLSKVVKQSGLSVLTLILTNSVTPGELVLSEP